MDLDGKTIAWLLDRPWSTIRWWAHKGWLPQVGVSVEGHKLYSTEQARELAARQSHESLDKHPDQRQH